MENFLVTLRQTLLTVWSHMEKNRTNQPLTNMYLCDSRIYSPFLHQKSTFSISLTFTPRKVICVVALTEVRMLQL